MRPVRQTTPRFASASRPMLGRLTTLGTALGLMLIAGGASAGESRHGARGEAASPPRAATPSLRHARDAEPAEAFWRRMLTWVALGKSDEGGEPDPNPNKGN